MVNPQDHSLCLALKYFQFDPLLKFIIDHTIKAHFNYSLFSNVTRDEAIKDIENIGKAFGLIYNLHYYSCKRYKVTEY